MAWTILWKISHHNLQKNQFITFATSISATHKPLSHNRYCYFYHWWSVYLQWKNIARSGKWSVTVTKMQTLSILESWFGGLVTSFYKFSLYSKRHVRDCHLYSLQLKNWCSIIIKLVFETLFFSWLGKCLRTSNIAYFCALSLVEFLLIFQDEANFISTLSCFWRWFRVRAGG